MNRRDFIKTSSLSIIALKYASFDGWNRPTLPSNWAWYTIDKTQSGDSVKHFLANLRSHGIEGILARGTNEAYEGFAPLARAAGIRLHAWRPTMMRGEYINEHPEWYTVNRDGESCAGPNPPYVNYYRWLCPSHEKVKELLISDYTSLCDIEGIDGIHLDYVRYCDVILPEKLQAKYGLVQNHVMAAYDYCYCDVCRADYKNEYGIDPMNLQDWRTNRTWLDFRLNQLVKLVRAIASAVREREKAITAAVFPTPVMAKRMVRQDWASFGLDAYMPMLYNIYYDEGLDWIGKCVSESLKQLPTPVPVYAGVLDGAVQGKDIPRVYKMVKEKGGSGLSFFTGKNLTDSDLDKLKNAIDSQ